jgi:hypothetical protein
MAKLKFKDIKKGMAFKASGNGRQPDDRIFRVDRKTSKPKKIFMSSAGHFTREEADKAGFLAMGDLEFTVEQVNLFLIPLPDETPGLFVTDSNFLEMIEET